MTFQLPNTQFLCATVGFPGSRKSSWAKSQLVSGKIVRVNRDAIRLMLGHQFNPKDEAVVHSMAMTLIKTQLEKGNSVICDDTNLNPKVRDNLKAIAGICKVQYVENRDFLDAPLERCIQDDLRREASVGKDVIMRMYYDYWRRQEKPENVGVRRAILCDIDGTIAHHNIPYPAAHNRDYEADTVDEAVKSIMKTFQPSHYSIFLSGRDDKHRKATMKWLAAHELPCDYLIHRPENDNRADYVVKKELYMEHVQGKFTVDFVLDDRPSVCRMWRAELGLKVMQVGSDIEF